MTADRSSRPGTGVRLAELLAVLSLGADLGMNQPMEHVMRECLIALRLGDRLGLDAEQRANLYYACLITWVGCHIDAYEQAKWFGDDLALKGDFRLHDLGRAHDQLTFMAGHVTAGRHGLGKATAAVTFATRGGMQAGNDMLTNHWYASDTLAGALGLDQGVRDVIAHCFERWDGKGKPAGLQGADLHLNARIVNLADVLEVYHRAHGAQAAAEVARQRAGSQFDPALVDIVEQDPAALFAALDETRTWDAVIDAEPGLAATLTDAELDTVLEAIADYVDVKSPYFLGHSRGVADLAAAAATYAGLPPAEVTAVRRAGLVHDLGRLGVSNTVWDKPTELTATESERVRLHPYLTERMLASATALVPLAAIAVQHHERTDGSGYPRGLRGDAMSVTGRLLAAADGYHAKLEPRPHRGAMTPDAAAGWLRAGVRDGKFDAAAADAVLVAAGHAVRRRKEWPAGLTGREVEVLRLLARGLSNKQVAERLVISRKTVDNHVEHIYTKTGAANRAQASLFAVRHGLMNPAEDGVFPP